jgi:tRNA dimethylallyltransferase
MADTSPHCSPTRNAEREPIHPRPIFLAGPTAVGKSEIALRLAEKIGGEIISADSMQVYRGLDIGTAKPSPAERARVPHHLIDVCDLNEAFDAAQFVRRAEKAVAEIGARGRTPVFCGGTGLYFKAFLEGLGEAPATDATLRAELTATPLETLLAELRQRDPLTFEKIDQKNPRRVIRAVEVIRLTGKPFSAQRADWKGEGGRRKAENYFCFTRQPDDLHQRINARVDEMFRRGLVAETEQLLQRGLAENIFAMQAIGYRQVVEHLRGERPLAETVELVKSRTRQFAKRQLTWFRRHGNCARVELPAGGWTEEVLQQNLAGVWPA